MSDLIWRPLTAIDLPSVSAIARQVHPDYPEDEAVFAERLLLAPEGCLGLEIGRTLVGYLLSHPWHARQPPALNSLLGAVPPDARSWYLHDLALLPQARGGGAGAQAVARLAEQAGRQGCASLSLVAVNGSFGFWQRHGFRPVDDFALAAKLASYDDAARYMERKLAPTP